MKTTTDPLDTLDDEARAKLRRADRPRWTAPMLATLTHKPFSDADWVYERKLDGVRCLVFTDGRSASLKSRNRNDLNNTYPELTEAIDRLVDRPTILDGEIVAFDGARTSFSRLQKRIGVASPRRARGVGVDVYLYLFDVLHLGDYDTTRVPLRQRKGLLREALAYEDPVRYTTHRNERGLEYLREACAKGWEGLIAKRADSRYSHSRSSDWLKFKCSNRQELVIVGFTDPQGSRVGFGALLLGYYDGGDLNYAGKVGTGFDDKLLRELAGTLRKMERKTSPLDAAPPSGVADAHWVTPQLVAEVGFTEWTGDGRLRHPRFIGLRADKDPADVVREKPADAGT